MEVLNFVAACRSLIISSGLLIVIISFRFCVCFNVDTKVPKMWHGPTSSYFGFSLDFIYVNPVSLGVVVGAPKNVVQNFKYAHYFCPLDNDSCETKLSDLTVAVNSIPKLTKNNVIWYGVSLSTDFETKKNLIICAHLYVREFPKKNITEIMFDGLCHLVEAKTTINPCDCRGGDPCKTCQVGTSVHFRDNDTILIGASGYQAYSGYAYKYSLTDNGTVRKGFMKHEKKQTITLAGYSVSTGKLLKNDLTIIVGAPRYDINGAALLYEKNSNSPDKIVLGNQAFSGFGMDVDVADFNNDGYEDLVVGAPLYYEPGYSGVVYLYSNGPEGLSETSIKLKGKKSTIFYDTRFGFAIACGGDLNQDGYNDLVVGAPFEESGAVYIFHGSSSSLQTYSQRILAADFKVKVLNAFGFSISKKFLDTDDNGYPDFLVGSYLSDMVMLVRTQPVVDVKITHSIVPKQIDPKKQTCESQKVNIGCFYVNLVYKYTWKHEDKRPSKQKLKLLLNLTITEKLVNRASFEHSKSVLFKTEKVDIITSDSNSSFPVYIQKSNKDWLNPINLMLTYNLTDIIDPIPDPKRLVPLHNYPVLNANIPNILRGLKVDFMRDCGVDNICESNIILKLSSPTFNKHTNENEIKASKMFKMNIMITNQGEDAHQSYLYINLTTKIQFIGVDTDNIQLVSCDPVEPTLIQCDVGNPLTPNEVVKFTVKLNPMKLQIEQKHLSISAFVNTTSNHNADDNKASILFKVLSEADLALISQSIPQSLFYDAPSNNDFIRYKDDIKFIEQIGPELELIFEIKNVGNVSFPTSKVIISWPHLFQNGNPLFYVVSEPKVLESRGSCSYPEKIVNPFELNHEDKKMKNGNDFDNQQYQPIFSVDHSYPEFHPMVCPVVHGHELLCETIWCDINPLLPGESSVVQISTRFWNSTFHKLFAEHPIVTIPIQSYLLPPSEVEQVSHSNDMSELKVVLMREEVQEEKVAWWIYVVAAVAGFLILCLFIFCLWKCGFFKRKKYEDQQQYLVTVKKKEEFADDSKNGKSSSPLTP